MKVILGRKVGMTRVATHTGEIVGATVIEALPNSVVQIRSKANDGYSALQVGYGDPSRAKKPQRTQIEKIGAQAGAILKEFRMEGELPQVGSSLNVTQFTLGDRVSVTSTSRGRGFAGTVKRHHFHMGPRSHGSMNIREPGSIGSTYPQRTIKGKRMAGRLGGRQATVHHLEILDILPDEHLLVIKGAVPGIRGAIVKIMSLSEASDE
ncbi:50S ribosomal protein L3 [Candidatus Berkelbacteria bacterium]|nr:50S ribosomal protein L3 [Candidatus Berkelbacteria bacterium]